MGVSSATCSCGVGTMMDGRPILTTEYSQVPCLPSQDDPLQPYPWRLVHARPPDATTGPADRAQVPSTSAPRPASSTRPSVA